jgi:hypothetical protein
MTWINPNNTKPLYMLSLENIITETYNEVKLSKTNDILIFSVDNNIASLVKGSTQDKKHLTHRQLMGVRILYQNDKPSMFAINFNGTRIIASDKKLLLDTVRHILTRRKQSLFKLLQYSQQTRLTIALYKTRLNNINKYFKKLSYELKHI